MSLGSLWLRTALAAAVVSGLAVFVNGLAVQRFDDATVYTTAKNLIAGIVLVGLAAGRPGRRSHELPTRRLPTLALIAVVGGAVPFVLFFEGLQRAATTEAAFIHKTLVIWVAVGATVWLGERLTLAHAAAIGALVAGHLVLVGGGPAAFGTGEMLILGATLLWSVEVVVVRRVLTEIPSDLAAAARMGGGAAVLVGWLAATGRLSALAEFDGTQLAWLSATGCTLALFVATWYRALSLAPAVDVTAILVLGAVITGILNVIVRDAPTSAADAVGYALLVAGAVTVARIHLVTSSERAVA